MFGKTRTVTTISGAVSRVRRTFYVKSTPCQLVVEVRLFRRVPDFRPTEYSGAVVIHDGEDEQPQGRRC